MGLPPYNVGNLDVKVWVNAILISSGFSMNELERVFPPRERIFSSPENAYIFVKRKSADKATACSNFWRRYARGSSTPIRTVHGRQLIEEVELLIPGTKRWIEMPLWRLLDPTPIGSAELMDIMRNLPIDIRKCLLISEKVGSKFTRRPRDKEQFNEIDKRARYLFPDDREFCLKMIVGGLTAVLAMIREAENYHDQPLHHVGTRYWKAMIVRLKHFDEIEKFIPEIEMQFEKNIARDVYSYDGHSGLFFNTRNR